MYSVVNVTVSNRHALVYAWRKSPYARFEAFLEASANEVAPGVYIQCKSPIFYVHFPSDSDSLIFTLKWLS